MKLESMYVDPRAAGWEVRVVDEPGEGGACHDYDLWFGEYRTRLSFQNGSYAKKGVNGITIEQLLQVALHRLQGFQSGDQPCPENETAIAALQVAQEALLSRRMARNAANAEVEALERQAALQAQGIVT